MIQRRPLTTSQRTEIERRERHTQEQLAKVYPSEFPTDHRVRSPRESGGAPPVIYTERPRGYSLATVVLVAIVAFVLAYGYAHAQALNRELRDARESRDAMPLEEWN